MIKKSFSIFLAVFVLLTFILSGSAQAAGVNQEQDTTQLVVSGNTLTWQISTENNGGTLTIINPDGAEISLTFAPGENPQYTPTSEGVYRYDLVVRTTQVESNNGVRYDPTLGRDEDSPANNIQSGTSFISETSSGTFSYQESQVFTPNSSNETESGTIINDVVTPDDGIFQGSICVGIDCINNESFGFDTIRLKENNTRIGFDDTSTSAGFPANDWQIVANDFASGGSSYLAFFDVTGNTTPFEVDAGAPTNALHVTSFGNIGIGTANPGLDVEILTGDTPAIRLNQSAAQGFVAQTWDIAGNEANFFIRDLTNGSKLPFRICPGAPTSSIDITSIGNVGIGTASATAKLEVNGNAKVDGNLLLNGYVSELSDVHAKFNFSSVDNASVLEKLADLPITTWNYKDEASQSLHMGPMAQDFYAAFGLGGDDTHLAPLDVDGVALAAIQELNKEVNAKNTQILSLQQQVDGLASRLDALEQETSHSPANSGAPWLSFLVGFLGIGAGYLAATRLKK